MDENGAGRMSEASERMAGATRDSFRVVADGAVAVQERNTKFAQSVFESGIETLRGQTETNRAVIEKLAEETGRQQDALRTMVQESVGAYMDFLNSAFSYSQRGLEVVGEAAREGERAVEETRKESRAAVQAADQN